MEIEPLTAGENSRQYLMGSGGSEDKLHMLRRLLQGLKERIESFLGEHMDLINDVNLESITAGSELNVLPQASYLINAPVRSPIYFQHIQAGAISNLLTGTTLIAGLSRWTLHTV